MAQDVSAYCADQVRRFDRDRWLAALFAPEPRRRDLLGLYAFNLEIARVRESVSEPMIGRIRLQWWRDTLDQLADGAAPPHPVAQALASLVQSGPVHRAGFARLLEGRERDFDEAPPADLAALESYLSATSATLNELALDALHVNDESARAAAQHVGLAWGLVGLVRAAPFQAMQRRTFLPADVLAAAGVALDALFEGRPGPGIARAVEPLLIRAREHLAAARRLRSRVPAAAGPVVLLAPLADAYLDRLRRAGFDPFDRRMRHRPGSMTARMGLAALLRRY